MRAKTVIPLGPVKMDEVRSIRLRDGRVADILVDAITVLPGGIEIDGELLDIGNVNDPEEMVRCSARTTYVS